MYKFYLFAMSSRQTKSYNGNKADKSNGYSTRLDWQVNQVAENVSKMRVLAFSRQSNWQVEWILNYRIYSDVLKIHFKL